MSQVLLVAAPYVLPVLVAILIPVVTYAVQRVLASLPASQRAVAEKVAGTAVAFAEQTASATLNGAGKKQVALELIEQELAHLHINIPASVVNGLLEEAVLNLNLFQPSTPVTSVPSSPSDAILVAPAPAKPLPAMPVTDTKGN